jgi:hypothetical protein
MKGVILLALAAVVIGAVLKAAGVELPLLDYPIGPFGGDLVRPEIEIEPPGFGDFPQP